MVEVVVYEVVSDPDTAVEPDVEADPLSSVVGAGFWVSVLVLVLVVVLV